MPSIPLNPRVYILEDKDIYTGTSTYQADVRWETVQETNGVLLGYKVYWGTSADDLQVMDTAPEATNFVVESLMAETEYFFKVSYNTKCLLCH